MLLTKCSGIYQEKSGASEKPKWRKPFIKMGCQFVLPVCQSYTILSASIRIVYFFLSLRILKWPPSANMREGGPFKSFQPFLWWLRAPKAKLCHRVDKHNTVLLRNFNMDPNA